MSSMSLGVAGLTLAIALVLWAMLRPRRVGEGQARLCEIVRTNNTVLISAIEAILAQADIPHIVLVHQRSLAAARGLLADAGLGHELNPDAG